MSLEISAHTSEPVEARELVSQHGEPVGRTAIAAPSAEVRESANSSGTGPLAQLPAELEGWNWGAFMLPLFWSIAHQSWLGLLVLLGGVPRVGWIGALIMSVVLGANGNKWAWQNRRFDSVHHFRAVQILWGIGGAIFNVVLVLIALAFWVSHRPQYGIPAWEPNTTVVRHSDGSYTTEPMPMQRPRPMLKPRGAPPGSVVGGYLGTR